MRSYQNLIVLENLYRLKALGFQYIDYFSPNEKTLLDNPNSLAELNRNISTCHLCDLTKSKKQSMSGYGDENADVMIIDFSVTQEQDSTNLYYSGRSGETLQKMIENVLHLSIENIFYTHSVKCKSLGSSNPSSSEITSCKAYLFSQIEFIQPKIIIVLGSEAYENITGDKDNFEKIRGHIIDFKTYKLVAIYHPNYLLRNPELKKVTFNDLKLIKKLLV